MKNPRQVDLQTTQNDCRRLWPGLRSRSSIGYLLLLCAAAAIAGCGSGAPFDIVPVTGKVTYSDGSLIEADRVVVTFVPQDVAAEGKDVPAGAMGEVNIADGTFPGLTTRKHLDGAILGRHKVLVQAMKTGPAGVGEPTDAVPARYASAETTPLDAEVTGSGDDFTFTIDRTP